MLTTSAETAVSKENESDWVRAHEALSRLARERAALDAEKGRWLLAALRAAAHVHLGFGSFSQYVERLFGCKPRSTQEKLRVAEALEKLPAIAAALERGALSWSAVRELTRVAVAETEESWLEVAQGKTVHQLEALVAGKQRGAMPSSSPSPEVRRHVLRFEVAPETLCLFREAIAKIQRDSDASLDDDSALMLMARHVLGGPADEGRASYQIALVVCPTCSRGYQQATGELVPVAADVVTMGACDGQHLGPHPPRTLALPGIALPRVHLKGPLLSQRDTLITPMWALAAKPKYSSITPTWALTPTKYTSTTPTWALTPGARTSAGESLTRSPERSKPFRPPRAEPCSAEIDIVAAFRGVGTRDSWTSSTFNSARRGAVMMLPTSSLYAVCITVPLIAAACSSRAALQTI